MSKILIEAEGRTVHMPDGRRWPAEGLEDPDVLFTRRRLADRDLIVKPADTPAADPIEEPAEEPKPKPAGRKPANPET